MASIWSLATLGSAIAANYEQLMLARVFIGVGEAAYGSVGLAVVLAVFPVYRRASLTGAFLAGGSFGSVLGVALGGALAVQFGWRWSFGVMAIVGLVLVVLYRLLISDKKLDAHRVDDAAEGEPVSTPGERAKLRTLFSTPSVIAAYVGSGLQLFIAGSLFAWLPSYLGRAYGLAPDKAAGIAAIAILLMGTGMIVCGAVTDRLARTVAIRKWTTAIVYTAASLVFLGIGFSLPHGGVQLLLLAIGVFFAAGTAGPAGAMVTNLTHESIRATALGTLSAGEQPARPRRRVARHRHPGRPVRPGRRHEDRPDRRRRRADRPAHRPQVLRRAASPRSTPRRSPDDRRDRRPRPGPPGSRRGPLADAAGRDPAGRADRSAARPERAEPAGPGHAAGPDRRGRGRPGGSRGPQRRRPGHRALGGDVHRDGGGRGPARDPAGLRHRVAAGVPVDRGAPRRTAGCRSRAVRCPSRASSRRAPTTRWATRCGCGPWRTRGAAGSTRSAPSAT